MADAPEINATPLLLSNWFCPYVHRVLLALSFKGALDRVRSVNIDLANKPQWFLQVSPHSKVPVITYTNGPGAVEVLYESLVLVQWVEDYFADLPVSLLPFDPAAKAKARIIANRFDSSAIPAWYSLLRSATREVALAEAQKLRSELAWLEAEADAEGPFLLGRHVTVADVAILPWLTRANLLKYYRNFDLFEGLPKLSRYWEALQGHPFVTRTQVAPDGQDFHAALVTAYAGYGKEPVDYFSS